VKNSVRNELPRFILDLLAAGKRAGDGVHVWLFSMARQLWPHRTRAEIIALLAQAVSDCGRAVPLSEIEAAVDSAKSCAWQPGHKGFLNSPAPKRTWPEVNHKARAEILADGGSLVELWEASPVRIESNEPRTEEIVDKLFPGDPLLCCGKYAKKPDGEIYTDFDTRPRENWRGELSALELILPSPMSALTGLTQDGKESAHTLENTGDRRFLVCEFDTDTVDEHAALLLHLASRAPLVLAVHSGGKSLHGFFYCAGQPEEKLRRFMEHAVSLGADRATWTRSQFVRMPDGTRANGKRQTVFFFNPRPIKP
jgi:hypothetical protein